MLVKQVLSAESGIQSKNCFFTPIGIVGVGAVIGLGVQEKLRSTRFAPFLEFEIWNVKFRVPSWAFTSPRA